MKITEMKGDAVKLNREMRDACLIHVCNNYAVMGSGIALQIKNEHPSAYRKYYHECHHCNTNLGGAGGVNVFDDESRIFNMIAQDNYGRVGDDKRFLNYGWLGKCLAQIPEEIEDYNDMFKYVPTRETMKSCLPITKIIVPVKMGAFRAGGDWEIVKEMVIGMLEDTFDEMIFCEFDVG